MWNNKTIEWIDVELTSFCNIACPGCLRQEKKEQVEPILNKDIIDFHYDYIDPEKLKDIEDIKTLVKIIKNSKKYIDKF